jgi:O-acetylhomoserine (thiol)-lyase
VTFDLKGGEAAAARFVKEQKLFALTASLGSTESLVLAPQMMRGRDLTPEQLRISAVTESTVRLSIGLEDPDDLYEDLERALTAAQP